MLEATMQKDDVARIAAGVTKAQREAIKQDRSGWPVGLATIVVFYGLAAAFGYHISFWFGFGILISSIVFLWEAGRNAQLEEAAVKDFLDEYFCTHLTENRDGQ